MGFVEANVAPYLVSAARAKSTRVFASAAVGARAVMCPIFLPGRAGAT